MTRDEIKELIMVILGQADYDLMKAHDPETAEEPDYAEEQMELLINTVEDHLSQNKHKGSTMASLFEELGETEEVKKVTAKKRSAMKKVKKKTAKKSSKKPKKDKFVSRADSSVYLNRGK